MCGYDSVIILEYKRKKIVELTKKKNSESA